MVVGLVASVILVKSHFGLLKSVPSIVVAPLISCSDPALCGNTARDASGLSDFGGDVSQYMNLLTGSSAFRS